MLNMKKVITIVSGLAIAMSLTSTTAVQAASFQAPKLGVAETAPTNPAIKKGEKIFVVVQDTKKQTVNVYTKDAKKTSQTVKWELLGLLRPLRRLMERRSFALISLNGLMLKTS